MSDTTRLYRKLAILVAIESTYGEDSTPAAADAMQMTNVTLTPMEANKVSRDLLLPTLGNQGGLLTQKYTRLQGSVEMAGAGTAGEAPAYGPLLRACGLSEVITAGTQVEYQPVSEDFESCTIYCLLDRVRHAMIGARGNVRFSLSPAGIPRFEFDFMGLFGPINDVSMPTVDLSDFVTPLEVSPANTPTLQLHGVDIDGHTVSVDLGNQVRPRFLINKESVPISDRQSTGSVTVDAPLLAAKDWFAAATARTRAALSIIHGTEAGNIIEIAAPAVEVDPPSYGESEGVLTNTMALGLCPVNGDDELVITVR